ncbi:hypothetical protein AMTRI_Chr06g171680 [Amborella trichopoda]
MLQHGGTMSNRSAKEMESLRFHLKKNEIKVEGEIPTRLIMLKCFFYNSIIFEKSVAEYTEEFYKLMAQIDIQDTEERLVSRHVGGLRLAVYDEVQVRKMNDAYLLAFKVEVKLSRGSTWKYTEVHNSTHLQRRKHQ